MQDVNYTTESLANRYVYPIKGMIGPPDGYHDLIELLNTARPSDVVELVLNSEGGWATTTIGIIHAMQDCEATVIATAEGLVASAASLIFFNADGWSIGKYSNFLLHDGSVGYQSKLSEMQKFVNNECEQTRQMYMDIYGKFLPEGEVEEILKGVDRYLTADEAEALIVAYSERVQEEQDKQAQEGSDEETE